MGVLFHQTLAATAVFTAPDHRSGASPAIPPPGGPHPMRTDVTTALAAAPATVPRPAFAPPVNLNGQGHYLHWGFVQISVANVVVIAVIAVVFVLALFLPFPKPKGRDGR